MLVMIQQIDEIKFDSCYFYDARLDVSISKCNEKIAIDSVTKTIFRKKTPCSW